MEWFFFWVFFSIFVGVFASKKRGRSGGGWFLLSLLISPLLAFLFILMCRNQQMKKCPVCAEHIKREAIICRYCHYKLPRQAVAEVSTLLRSTQKDRIEALVKLKSRERSN